MGEFTMRIQNLFGGEDIVEKPEAKKSGGGKSTALSCAKCSMHGQKQVISPSSKTANILVIGPAPGMAEEEQGKLGVGRGGELLVSSLRSAGFDVGHDLQLTTVCKCRPVAAHGTFREPTLKETQVCVQLNLEREIERYDNIIVLGRVAQLAVLGKVKGDIRGNVVLFKGKRVGVTSDAFSVVRMQHSIPGIAKKFVEDLAFFHSVFMGGYAPKFTIVIDEKTRNKCLEDVLKSKELFFDVETSGLELDSILNVVGVATDKNAYVIPVVGKYFENKDLVKRIFAFKDKVYVAYNTQFDYNLLMVNGLCERDILLADAMILEHMLNSSRVKGSYGLKKVSVEKGFRWSALILNPASPDKFEDLYLYNAEDIINTREVYHVNQVECKQKKTLKVADEVVFPAINVISEMELTGIDIDLAEMKRVRVRLIAQIDILDVELTERFGERNWGSTAQLQGLLTKWLKGAPAHVLQVTGTSAICTDEAALRIYQEYAEVSSHDDLLFFCNNMLQLRELRKLLSTYIEGLSAKVQSDGRLRGHFSLIGTETGRLSSSGPNLQNIPRDGRIKSMFVAPEGWTLLEADASQIELRVVASVAPEPIMITAYNAGEDLHSLTASYVLGVPQSKITKAQRQTAKAVNFGFIYGQTWQGFKNYAKGTFGVILTDDEAKTFRQGFFSKYFGIDSWHKRVTKEIYSGGRTTTTVFNRIRYLTGKNDGQLIRQALNTPVQSPASDCNLISMHYIWKHIDPTQCRCSLTVHDQCMLVVKSEYLKTAVEIVRASGKHVSSRCSWLKVPFVLDLKTGQNWGHMKELK